MDVSTCNKRSKGGEYLQVHRHWGELLRKWGEWR